MLRTWIVLAALATAGSGCAGMDDLQPTALDAPAAAADCPDPGGCAQASQNRRQYYDDHAGQYYYYDSSTGRYYWEDGRPRG